MEKGALALARILLVALLLVTYIPALTLFLPHLLY